MFTKIKLFLFYEKQGYVLTLLFSSFIILLLILFSSCKDNPVTPKNNTPYQYDSARYSWKIDTVADYTLMDIWGIDTNNIYFLTQLHIVKYNGSEYETIYYGIQNFSSGSIGGISNNNIYIGGSYYFSINYQTPGLLKFDGSTFRDIPILAYSINYSYEGIMWIYQNNENEVWFGSDKGRLFMYDGNIINYYIYDTNYYIRPLLKTSSNDFYVAGFYDSTILNPLKSYIKIFNFKDRTWNIIYSQINYLKNGQWTSQFLTPYNKFNNELLACGKDGFYKFNINDFNKIINFPDFYRAFWFDGSSEQDLLTHGTINNNTDIYLFQWNGIKWSKENFRCYDIQKIKKIQNKYIVIGEDADYYDLIYYGIPKNISRKEAKR